MVESHLGPVYTSKWIDRIRPTSGTDSPCVYTGKSRSGPLSDLLLDRFHSRSSVDPIYICIVSTVRSDTELVWMEKQRLIYCKQVVPKLLKIFYMEVLYWKLRP